MKILNIPVGTSNFAEIRRKGSYFIDKTGLIVQLLKTQSTKATLITRPRRFGKTLCMSMLSEFFDIQKESRHFFAGLSVMENEELCRQWMNQYPTLFLTIAKESIFTGTNNFVSDTISDTQLNEYFGFTQDEVNRLLADTGLTPYAAEIKEWYNGYHFGDFDVYCPWDVMNHV